MSDRRSTGAAPAVGGPAALDGRELAAQLSDLARALEHESSVDDTLQAIVTCAADTVPGAEHASLSSILRRREVVTRAATGDLPRQVDQAQYDTGQGPCLDSLYRERTARIPDTAAEERWPDFTARAAELGVGSMLSVQLYTDGEELGALNLHSTEAGAFDEESEQVALLLSTHAAIAMAGALQQQQLRNALESRDLIGQAKGIVMERFGLTADQAFTLLVRASQHSNVKLHDIARTLVEQGSVADLIPQRRPHHN